MNKYLNFLLALTLYFTSAMSYGRVLDSTEEIRLQPATGTDIFLEGDNITASKPLKVGASKNVSSGDIDLTSEVTGILPIANGGTGSATQNFVDLTTNQTIAGNKDFTGVLSMTSTAAGFKPPRMTEAQRDAIGAPAAGDLVYNTTSNALNVYNGSAWVAAGDGGLDKWLTGTAYSVDDVVWDPTSEKIYRANTGHTAGATFAGDIANWDELADNIDNIASSTDNAIVRFDGTGGDTVQDSVVTVDDVGVVAGITQLNVDNLRLDGNTLSSTNTNGDVVIDANGTGVTDLNDGLEMANIASATTPPAGEIALHNDGGTLSYTDENAVKNSVKNPNPSDILTNYSFEKSYAGAPATGWTYTPSGADVVTISTIDVAHGTQKVCITPAAETFTFDQTADLDAYDGNLAGWLPQIEADFDLEVCFLNGAGNPINCANYDTSVEAGKPRRVLTYGTITDGTVAGVRIRSTASVTGTACFDDVRFTDEPLKSEEIRIDSEWVNSGALTLSATTSAPTKGTMTNDKVWCRRVGDSLEVRVEYDAADATGANAGTGDYLFQIPTTCGNYSGLTIDSSKITYYTAVEGATNWVAGSVVGNAVVTDTGATANAQPGDVVPYDSTHVRVFTYGNAGYGVVSSGFYSTVSPTDTNYGLHYTVPIAGWTSAFTNVIAPDSSTLTRWQQYTPTISGFGTVVNVSFWWRQVGGSIEILGSFDAGTVAATEAQIGLPSSYAVKSGLGQPMIVGDLGRGSSTGSGRFKFMLATSGDTFLNVSNQSTGAENPINGDSVAGSGEGVTINATVPIEVLEPESQVLAMIGYKAEEIDLTSSGKFTGGSILVSRVGKNVSVTAKTAPTFASSSAPASAAGIIPSWARPVYTGGAGAVYDIGASRVREVHVANDGTLSFEFRDWTGGTSAITNAEFFTISFSVE